MPLRRYFLFVGGGLLTLLFVAGALPQPKERTESGPHFPVIRIHSELKRPPAVVIDTSLRMIAPAAAVQADVESESPKFVAPEDRIGESFPQSVVPLQRQVSAGKPKEKTKRQRFAARTKHLPIHVAQRTNFGSFDTSW